jgi:group I intron endonuclease
MPLLFEKSGIYRISNSVNNKQYIGSSLDIEDRFKRHKRLLKNGIHFNRHLQYAYNKYGEEVFKFEVILYCEPEIRTKLEEKIIKILEPNVYNIELSPAKRVYARRSEATKEKISQKLKGRVMSKDTREKMSLAKKGTIRTESHQNNLTNSLKGKKRNSVQRAKMKLAQSIRCKPLIAICCKTGEAYNYSSFAEANKSGFDNTSILRVINGRCKQHKGYIWQYAREVDSYSSII